jgi:hypothetical protein
MLGNVLQAARGRLHSVPAHTADQMGWARQNTNPYYPIHRFWNKSLLHLKNLYGIAVLIKSDGLHRSNLPCLPVIRDDGQVPHPDAVETATRSGVLCGQGAPSGLSTLFWW